ncbi:hypothetical protein B0J14DRAFT_656255 [Halenospora varia]|nr:hypothetical protein B0J14DRAFT_656255 [Halenospora varia]
MRGYCILFLTAVLGLEVVGASPSLPRQTTPAENPPPSIVERDVAIRATTAAPALATGLCGWQGGDIAQPWACPVQGTCIINANKSVNAVGCCGEQGCAPFRTKCIPATTTCDSACQNNRMNTICGTEAPLCATFTYPGAYTEVRCMSSVPAATDLQIKFTYANFSTLLPLPRLETDSTKCSTTASVERCIAVLDVQTQTPKSTTTGVTTKPTTTTSKATGTSTPTSTPTPTPTPTESSSSSSSNTGAIVGGVIGGVGAIAIAAAGVFFFFRRKRAQKNEQHLLSVRSSGAGPEPEVNPNNPGAMKAELQAAYVNDPTKKQQTERYEVDGVSHQQVPLMELEANETPAHRR